MDILKDNRNFTLGKGVNGPLLAVFVGIDLFLTFVINLFVLIFTFCHPRSLKQPSIIFLTNFLLVNLMMATLVMPCIIVTGIFGEWIFGETPEEKNATCQFFGFVLVYALQLIIMTLTVISVDRFYFIVKPLFYKRVMNTSVAVVVVTSVWIISCLMHIPPFLGLGEYKFLESLGTCGFLWIGQRDYVLYLCSFNSVFIIIIVVTTLWTFCFSRKFIQTIRQQHCTTDPERNTHEHIYMQRMKKLFGIFGVLLTVVIVTIVPGVIVAVIQGFMSDALPLSVFAVVFVLFLLNCVINPIVQSYFRKEVYEFIVHCCRILKVHASCSWKKTEQ